MKMVSPTYEDKVMTNIPCHTEMKKNVCILVPLMLVLQISAASHAEDTAHKGDVTDLRVIRRVEQHPYAWKIWQPFIIQGHKKKELLVAFGVQVNGKNDMGDILVSLSRDEGDTWEAPVPVFDHRERQGAIQFAYANPVLYRAPGQDVIWCFAMRCPIVFRNSEESQLVGAFTADGGRSWTPVEMAMHYTGPLILNAGIVETEIQGQRRFLLPAHRNTLQKDPLGSRDHFILSSSSLLEWRLEAFIRESFVRDAGGAGAGRQVLGTARTEADDGDREAGNAVQPARTVGWAGAEGVI